MPKRRTYNVHEAKTQLSKLLKRVSEGQDVYIARAGVPVARLVPVTLPEGERVLGSERGRITFGDDFNAPLPAELLDAFEA
ncbi:MAG TPA: type II toxin-antitoxin system prevent-host-death family antitoxin [Gemmatimonadaceae bacterium]|nr:type II toxin-antitoxin system prevent-host-death family antitoxin [Gemmatimonadaceae bacterium]